MPPRRRTTGIREASFYIPPEVSILQGRFKVEIVKGGVATDVTSFVTDLNVARLAVDEGLDYCVVNLDNTDGRYIESDGSMKWVGGEIIKIYQDYDTVAGSLTDTHLLFKGKIHAPKTSFTASRHVMTIYGRKLPELRDDVVNVVFPSGTKFYDAARSILDDYPSMIDLTTFDANLSGQAGTFAATYSSSPIGIVQDIFLRAGWTGYFDNDVNDDGKFVLHAFTESQVNNDVAAVHGQNLIDLDEYGVDTSKVFTRVRVLGGSLGGGSIIREKFDSSLESSLWKRKLVIRDNNVTSMSEADDKVDFELSENSEQRNTARVTMIAQRGLNPSESFKVASQDDGVNGFFKASRIDYSLGSVFVMRVDISRKNKDEEEVKFTLVDKLIGDLKDFDNPNDMKFTYNFTFDDNTNISTDSNVEYVEGKVKTTAGEGSFTSNILTLSENVTKVDFSLESPENIEDSRIFVSADGGTNETEILINDENVSTTVSSGSQLRVRMVLTGSTTALAGLVVRAK